MRKSKSKGYVLSLSGGADSASCAILVAEMVKRGVANLGWSSFLQKIGREDLLNLEEKSWKSLMPYLLTTAYQATANSGDATFSAAETLAKSMGASFHHWSIQEEFSSMTQKIANVQQRALSWEADDIALQNIQARLRSPMIWMLANMQGKLLLTTSNRSEGDVGYSTMDGDSSGSLAPISGVDKVFVRQFLRWAEMALDYPALKHINALAPTAELRPPDANQSDETDLMPYTLLVAIERAAIKERKSPVQVYQALSESTDLPPADLKKAVIKFFTLWSRNQWKRERTAPSFHLDDFNIDPKTWCRFPILSSGFEQEIKELEAW
jgi:NAD+ synthase (glutamine-hydrolysing)